MRRVHERQAHVVLGQQARVVVLARPRQQLELRRRADDEPPAERDCADAAQLPPAQDPGRGRLAQGQGAELEQVARGVLLRARVEEQPAGPAGAQLLHRGRRDGRDRVLEGAGRRVARGRPRRVHAVAVAAEERPQELRREQRRVREPVRRLRQRRPGAHREREGLVLLHQVEEAVAVAAEVGERAVGEVGRPPGGGHERVAAADLEPRRLAPEGDLDGVEEPGQPAVGLEVALPGARERPDRVDGDDPDAQAELGQAPGEVELADVAPEEVPEVDGRDEHVDPRRGVVADGEAQGLDLLPDAPQAGVPRGRRRPGGGRARPAGGRPGAGAAAGARGWSRPAGAARRRRGRASTPRRASPASGARRARARRAAPGRPTPPASPRPR